MTFLNNLGKTIINNPPVITMFYRWHKPCTNGWFILVLTTVFSNSDRLGHGFQPDAEPQGDGVRDEVEQPRHTCFECVLMFFLGS